MKLLAKLKAQASQRKRELHALWLACGDSQTPWPARFLIVCVIAYALSPIDLIPKGRKVSVILGITSNSPTIQTERAIEDNGCHRMMLRVAKRDKGRGDAALCCEFFGRSGAEDDSVTRY